MTRVWDSPGYFMPIDPKTGVALLLRSLTRLGLTGIDKDAFSGLGSLIDL